MNSGYMAIQTQHFIYYYIIYYHYTKMRVSVSCMVVSPRPTIVCRIVLFISVQTPREGLQYGTVL
jgi:hypothetical protein